jgi:hypothetical protein
MRKLGSKDTESFTKLISYTEKNVNSTQLSIRLVAELFYEFEHTNIFHPNYPPFLSPLLTEEKFDDASVCEIRQFCNGLASSNKNDTNFIQLLSNILKKREEESKINDSGD